MSQVKVAVIGCGRIAGHHCRSIQKNKELKLIAVCDLIAEKADKYGQEFSVPSYVNYHSMLKEHPEIEVVAIVTPSGMHYEHSLDILRNYRKHIIVEKPTYLKLSHFREVSKVAESLQLKVFPVFQNRYNLAVQRVLKALNANELGQLNIVSVRVRWCRPQRYYDLSNWRGTWSMDGGAISNQGVHHIDLLRYLGGEISEVSAIQGTLGANIEVEDTCMATLKFANGAMGSLEITTAARPDDFEASISILGSQGMAQIGGLAVNELQIFTPQPSECQKNSEDFSQCVYGNGHEKLYQDILKSLKHQSDGPISTADAFHSLALLHAFYVSAEKQIAIKPSEFHESARLGRADEQLAQVYRTVEATL
ncbi:MAG TPA: Gfo/Idh/MocA family oxidoreductase [Pseudobdellovibrionaceae bacterium]|nr:Gfo/Idh/MocA family oxidoreductase [Pseudobdellovibrionaceae bacterium]